MKRKTKVTIKGRTYKVGYPECEGCEYLIITHGICGYEGRGCKYPDSKLDK